MKLTSFDQIHNRNYHKEKQEKAGIKSKGFFERLRETSFDSPLLAATGVAVFEAARQSSSYISTSKLGIDSVYGSIRKLENRLPLFNIPLRTSQLGDLMSPFVSGQALKWEFAGSELFSKNGSLREDFKFLNEIAGRDLSQELKSPDSKIFFEKKGSVYGDIFLERGGSKKTLVEDVFMMQRPSSKTGAISQIWDAGKRPTNFYKPLSEEWDKAFTSLGFSAETAKKMRFAGGVMRTIVGETTHEFFKGMNRFLKEPVPGINKLLDWSHDSIQLSQKIEELGETGLPLKRLFGNIGAISTDKADSLGRLPRWLRPYISEGYWTKNAGRMAVALAAKGTMFTTVLPSMYGALDYARAKMEGTPAPVSGALFGAVGFGIGGLIKSRDFDRGIFKGTKFLTKTQLAGGIMGAAIGALPTFDKGISAGFGSLYGSLNIVGSRAWETIGGQKARERQEGLFPGITNPMTGVGFVMGGGFVGYFNSEIGTSKALLQSLSGRALNVSGRTQESILSSIASGNVSDLLTSDITEAFRKEQTGKVFSIRDAAKVLRGESKEASTITGLVARSYQSLYEKGDVPEEFIKRMSTVEGSEELASRLFTHLDDLSSTIHKANKNLDPDYLLKGPLGRTFDRMKDVLQGRPSFTRGALKGGLAFLGVSQLGAVAAGAMGGDLNPVNLIPGWLISLTGGGASSKETEEVFTGKKEVAIRKGRFWSLGSSPWEGTKVAYHRLHRSVLMQSDAEVNALYGSWDEKIAYDPVLHPLRNLIDDEFKYHRDMRLSEISPTPQSSRMFSDVPILGDLLAATVGEVIKPTRNIRASEWKNGSAVIAPSGDDRFHDMRSAPAVESLGGLGYTARDLTSMQSVAKDTFKRMTEQAGLRGFMFGNSLSAFGYEERTYDPVIERGDSLLSARAKFWSLNLGDPMGSSEAARRYLTKDRNTYYNPLSNMAPSWLPENNYWLDFRHGNYFNKVQEGWLRLPGAAYQQLNPELEGLHPENYSIGHKYKILSDVAYGSNEYLMAKEKAKQAITSGNISKRDLQLIETANKHLGEKKIKRSFRDYQFERPMSKEQEFTVMGVADDGSIITAETGKRQLKLAGLNMSMAGFVRKKLEEENFKTIADAERAGSEARANAISELRDKLRPGTKIKGHIPIGDDAYSGAETELYIPSLNESIKGLGAEVDKDSTFSSSIKYNAAQRFLGGLWEKYTHNADLPITPAMAFNKIAPFQPHAKFIKRLTPIELYAQTRVYGRELQMWQNYKSDFIDTAINDVRSKVSGDFIPNKVAYQRTMIEYFDKLKWLKFHMLEQASSLHDNSELSEYYAQKKKQTMYGADPYRGYTDIFRALPGTERDFYREFVEESDPTNQERILELAPDPMKRIYIAQWQNKRIKALGHKAEAGIASQTEKTELKNLYKLRESEGFINNSELKQQYENETRGTDISYADWVRMKELKEYFKAFKLPKANYVGFDPRVDLEDVKLKVAQTDGIDIHDIGLWDQQAASINRKPYVDAGASLLQDWHEPGQNEIEFEAQIRRTIRELGSKLHLTPVPGQQNKVLLSTMDTREHEIRNHLKRGVF